MRILFSLLLSLALASCVLAQNWEKTNLDSNADRRISPKKAFLMKTDGAALKALLFAAPHERQVRAEASPILLNLPAPDGNETPYRIVAYDVAAPAALAAYPGIRTWYGVNTANPAETVFLDWTERGFHASIRGGDREVIFIDPLARGDVNKYQAYFQTDLADEAAAFSCGTLGDSATDDSDPTVSDSRLGDCELREYRTTITATGEYSNYHGATSSAQSGLVQSAVVTSVNRINQVFTRDLSLRLQLIGNNDQLYYYDSDSDPFNGGEVGDLIDENTPVVDDIIGSANYDYGHIYTRGRNNGVAYLRASCRNGLKAGGATSRLTPENDPFDIDYVAHEMGHNLGGNHTQNNNCNYSNSAGMEPGSASTIMGYAGICSPNVQTSSDDYFHGRSIEEITTYIELGTGATCGTIIDDALNSPTVSSPTDESIPFGTPFVLTSGATGDGTLSYNWEQYDVERGATMPPVGTNEQGPLFRSLDPVASPERYFPNLPSVIAGTQETWEVLPTVSRDLNFRATVRNFNAAYGCAGEDDVLLTVDETKGPFLVTDPNNANQWSAGQTAQIQWDVADTDAAPINSALVSIFLSTDGGQTFNAVLTGTANDGFAEIMVPNETTTDARIMVRSDDNVFYNVSSLDFSIVSATGTPDVTLRALSPISISDCFAQTTALDFRFVSNSSGGATAPINWSIDGLPAGITSTFGVNPTQPGGLLELTLTGFEDGAIAPGTYELTLTGTSAEGTVTETITVEKTGGSGGSGPVNLNADGMIDDIRPFLTAEDSREGTFEFQVATDADFNNIVFGSNDSQTPRFTVPDYLTSLTTYFWRVRLNGTCGQTQWSESSFTTGDCPIFSSTAAPVTISNGEPTQIAEMTVDIPTNRAILDLDVYQLNVQHTWLADLEIDLVAPNGDEVRLFDRSCERLDDILTSFDDENNTALECPPVNGDFLAPASGDLATFDGLMSAGQWTLRVLDQADADGGELRSFALKVCLDEGSLPVDLVSFNATGKKDYIALDWATELEENNFGFYVERSLTDLDSWTELGFVAAGTDYLFNDQTAEPFTDYVYRLRQQDLDGRVNYSELRTARIGQATKALRLFPNPTSGVLNYRLNATTTTEAEYTLTDVNGRLLNTGKMNGRTGTISLDALPAGVYLLRSLGETYRVVRL